MSPYGGSKGSPSRVCMDFRFFECVWEAYRSRRTCREPVNQGQGRCGSHSASAMLVVGVSIWEHSGREYGRKQCEMSESPVCGRRLASHIPRGRSCAWPLAERLGWIRRVRRRRRREREHKQKKREKGDAPEGSTLSIPRLALLETVQELSQIPPVTAPNELPRGHRPNVGESSGGLGGRLLGGPRCPT